MKKYQSNETGAFNPRIFITFLLCCSAILLAMFSFASTPTSGTLTDTSGPLNYSAGPFNQPNQSPAGAGQLDVGPRCGTSGFPCDSYLLTITLPAGYTTTYPGAAVKVTAGWTDTGTGQSDYDLYVYKGNVATTDGSQLADYQSASGSNPEVATIFPVVADGQAHQYSVKIVPYTPSGETVKVKIELFPGVAGAGGGTGGGGTVPFGGADPTVVGNPRYMNFYAPVGSSAESSSGEFNIGFNPAKGGRIMVMNSGPIWRITPAENALAGARPECCEGLWEDRSSGVTDTGLDPILWTDQKSGRTFASNSTAGPNGLYAFTDDDGESWIPVGVSPLVGADHQTIATGPYPASLSALSTILNKGHYVIYCSQDLVGANCNRSDNLGSAYGPAVPATGPGASNSQGCGGLHGHARVSPDGTAYLPDKSCGTVQGGALSLDGSTTPWTEFQVKKLVADANGPAFTTVPQADGADPSVGLDSANTIYYCYVNNQANGTEGHAHVAVGKRNDPLNPTKINWIRDTDVGATHGIVNAAHPEAIAGDAGRAACGFFGTNVPGDYENGNFGGAWYAFVATTYDEGKTWVTVNATPNDPVQNKTGIWQRGGSGDQGDRNLLDFNEVTMDDHGRVLYGYSDGCTSAECVAGTAKSNLGAAMRVARQIGGRSLLAAFDPSTDTTVAKAPKASCLSGTRDQSGSRLTWKVPDNGGKSITSYKILRGTASGNETLIATYTVTSASKAEYFDATANPSVAHLFYKIRAVNSAGLGAFSNEVDLQVVAAPPPQNPCLVPGATVLTDSTGDSLSPEPGTDMMSASIAQPYAADGNIKLVVTIKTDPSASVHPVGSAWYLAMKVPGATAGTFRYTGVRMESGATNSFFYYTPGANSSGGVDGRFVDAESPADPSSSYDPANGTITIVVKASDLGLSAGSAISGFVAGSSQTTDPTNSLAGATEVWDPMPNSLAFGGSYTIKGNNTCNPNATPTPTPTPSATPTATPATPKLNSMTVVNAPSGTKVAAFKNGYSYDLKNSQSVKANPASASGVVSVVFKLDGTVVRTENGAPYTVAGDSKGVYTVWKPSVGNHVLIATPYNATNGAGTSGAPIQVNFTVVNTRP
ncbi:MAG: fibronectin type III domain-containing protein [Verrucomicrobiota bacterium]